MACGKFEESGLLYLSGELGESEARGYESHLGECGECALETESYKREHAAFYSAEILGENPSPAVDSEILRVCAGAKGGRALAFLPMAFIRKYAPIPLFLMLVMVAVGGYVRHHSMNAESLRAKLDAPATGILAASPDRAAPAADDGEDESDSSADGLTAPKPMGDMSMEGVMTVKGGGEPAK